jgi:hypothetical protein
MTIAGIWIDLNAESKDLDLTEQLIFLYGIISGGIIEVKRPPGKTRQPLSLSK